MKPSEKCKQAGLKSLAELSATTGESVQTLINWSKNKPQLFNVVLTGAVAINEIKMDVIQKIEEAATTLEHDWIILDALKGDDSPDLDVYMGTIAKIKKVEVAHTQEEIEEMNLLVDIW